MSEKEISIEENDVLDEVSYTKELMEGKTVYISPSTLYVVATPIGRIIDLSMRAIRVLESVDFVAAEDTRRTYILLNLLGIKKEVYSNQKFNEYKKTEFFIQALKEGKSIAVVSDAGTPCISDPGNELIKRAIEEGINVTPVPGACAAVSGASISGFDLTSFMFCGFFPRENQDKKAELSRYRSGNTHTFIYYESPKRIFKTIQFFIDEKLPCKICLCNDLTKTHERFYRGTPEDVFAELSANPNAEKGEFTMIVEIDKDYWVKEREEAILTPEAVICETMVNNNCSSKEAIDIILNTPGSNYRKNELKAAALNLKNMF